MVILDKLMAKGRTRHAIGTFFSLPFVLYLIIAIELCNNRKLQLRVSMVEFQKEELSSLCQGSSFSH